MNEGNHRIELILIDLIERMTLPQDVRIIQNGDILYTGSITRIPSYLLNEKVLNINTVFCTELIRIVIE